MRVARYALIPAVAALAAVFAVLSPTGADATVSIVGGTGTWRYQPGIVRIDPGDRVMFRNDTRVTHTASCTQPECWDTGDIQPGETVFVAFDERNSYGFVCRYHRDVAGLAGRLVVGDVPEQIEQTGSPSPSPAPTGELEMQPSPTES